MIIPNGQFRQVDFLDNQEGLNLVDSPFKVRDGQAVSGQNFNYLTSGAIGKRRGHSKINSVANAETTSLGLGLNNSTTGTKTIVRAAGTRLQVFDSSVPSFTNLTEDTTSAGSAFLTSGSTVPVVFSQFNTASNNILWCAGGGMSSLYGVYSSSKVTKNGVPAPTNSAFTATTGAGSSSLQTGTYRYTLAFRKLSTQALSNAGGEASASVSAGQNVTLAWTLTNNDTTKYDKIYVYRSALNGSASFTTGDLIAQLDSTATGYTDTGTSVSSSQNVPRAGNTLLDNSELPAGTYKTCVTFKRHLVTASGSTVYSSDLIKPESWPSGNSVTIPSGGDIRGLAVLSFTSVGSGTIDEILCVFKENEMWIIQGTGDFTALDTFSLKFISNSGAVNQSCIVPANGYLIWMSASQFYLWSGSDKPVEIGKLIKPLFAADGDLDKTKLGYATGQYVKKLDQVIWYLSHKIYGEQKFQLKLDLKATLPRINTSLGGTSVDGVFIPDQTGFAIYAALAYIPTSSVDETLLLGDSSGFIYSAYSSDSDGGSAISFKYSTKPHDCGNPNIEKRFHYVVVWVEELGAWNLTLDWWTTHNFADGVKSTRALPISEAPSSAIALWDVAYWDDAYWDDYAPKLRPLWFHLSSDAINNNEGRALRLQFRQEGADEPVTIHGYSILFTEKGINKAA